MQEGDAVLVRGTVIHDGFISINDGEEWVRGEAVSIALVRALVRVAGVNRAGYQDAARCWDCGALNRLPDSHDPECVAKPYDALLAAAPWLGDE